jgi:hypothetical protein
LVFSHAHAGGKRATLAGLRKFVRQTLQSPALGKEVTKNPHERIPSARRIGLSGDRTEYRVE